MAPTESSKTTTKSPLKKMNPLMEIRTTRLRTSTVPKLATPNNKVQKPMTGNVSQSSKKAISKRRPLPAHAGIPITEKMKESIRKGFAEMKPLTEVTVTRPQTPKVATPKPKVQKPIQTTNNVAQSTKTTVSKRPLPAHSGVPITEKMKELLRKDLETPKEVKNTRLRTSTAPTRQRTCILPKDIASNTKQQKGLENVPPSAKKATWRVPAHYGVPITEKMKQSLKRGFIG